MSQKKILPPTVLFGAILAEVIFHYLLPVMKVAIFPYNILGLLLLAIGAALNILADNSFKAVKTTVKPFQESSALVTTGVFKISRNPMYIGSILMLLGINVLLGSLSPIVAVICYAVIIHEVYIKAEEAMLAEKFGGQWLAYKARVRRWI